jgi:CDP-2,3-bis-(O-geranylgeranyl)-sn-glycerol synthase
VILEIKLLVLLGVANGAPIVARWLLGRRAAWPLDGGLRFVDGQPLFGATKTLRGLLAAVAACTACAPLLGFAWTTGLLIGLFAMLGDLAASFVKRRLRLTPSNQALGLDQIPEALLPLLAVQARLALDAWQILALVAVFTALQLVISPLLYRLGIRHRPY